MMKSYILIFFALLSGFVVPIQSATNAYLAKALANPFLGTLVSLVVSLVVVIPILILNKVQLPSLNTWVALPLWSWIGGVMGVIFISSALILSPKLGVNAFIACVILGQLFSSIVIDKFGLFHMPVQDIPMTRILSLVLVTGGVLLNFISKATK